MTSRPESNNRISPFWQKALFGFVASIGYRVVAVAVNLISIPLTYRFLPKKLVGVWFLFIGAQMLLGLFDFGLGQTLQRRIAFAKGSQSARIDDTPEASTKQRILDLITSAAVAYVPISVLVAVSLFIGGRLYFPALQFSDRDHSAVLAAWTVMSVGYGLAVWASFVDSTLNGLGDVGWPNLLNTATSLASLGGYYYVLSAGHGLVGMALVWASRALVLRVAGWTTIKLRHRWVRVWSGRFQTHLLAGMISPSLQWWFALVGYFFMNAAVRYFLAALQGAEQVPDFIATFSVLSALQGFAVSATTTSTPLFSHLFGANRIDQVRRTLLPIARASLTGLILSLTVFLVFGEMLFSIWLGPGHFVGYPTLLLLVVMIVLEAHQGLLQPACVASEKLGFYKYTVAGGAITALLSVILIPRLGPLGAAAAMLIGQATTQNWAIPRLAYSILSVTAPRALQFVVGPAALYGASALLIGLALKHTFTNQYVALGAFFVVLSAIGYKPVMALLAAVRSSGQPSPGVAV